MSIAAAGSKILLLIGAGVTGNYIISNSQLSDLLADISKVLTKHLKEKGEGGSADDGTAAALSAQVKKLTQELKYLSSMQSRPIVVSSSSEKGAYGSSVVPVLIVGLAGYGYMWWKGYTLGDFMYVTRKKLNSAIENFSKQMEGLTSNIAATKKQLNSKLEDVFKSIHNLGTVTDQVKDEVSEVKSEIGNLNQNVGSLQSDLFDVKGSLESIQDKQDFATQGIMLLCKVAVEGFRGEKKPEVIEGLQAFTQVGRSLSGSSNSGLKMIEDLEVLAERIQTPANRALTTIEETSEEVPRDVPKPGYLSSFGSVKFY